MFTAQLPDDGRTTLTDRTDEISTIGLWGPVARDMLVSITDDDVSGEGFGMLSAARSPVGGRVTVLASRISYVGELGWELYVADGATPPSCGRRCSRPAPTTAWCPSASASTARPAASRRATGPTAPSSTPSARSSRPACSGPRSRPPTSSAARPTSRSARQAPQTVLCTLTVDDHTSASGTKRYMLGGEPILTRDGGTLTDGHGHHPYVTSAGLRAVAGQARAAGLPAASTQAAIGNELAVSYMEELYPVTVGSVDATAAARPGQRADALMMTNVLVCVKRVPGLLQRGAC